jgi:hypothetical protein
MSCRVVYLAGGKLHVRDGQASERTYSSKFGEEIRERAVRVEQRQEWKRGGRGAAFAGAMLAGAGAADPAHMRIAITHLARGRRPGEVLYVLETDAISAVLALDLASGDETRLLHSSEHRVRSLCAGPEAIACAIAGKAGTCGIGAMEFDGSEPALVTEGDSVDLHPAWDPKAERELLFQSAGTARDASGRTLGLGPCSIQRLRVERGQIEPVLESPKHDFLAPRFGPDGALHVVQRPYRGNTPRPPFWRGLLELLLIPWRLLQAIFGWLNFFSARYSGRTLLSGGPEREGPDVRELILMGNAVDASEQARRKRAAAGEDGLVPKDWELVRLEPDGQRRVLARGVSAYDFADDGALVYTNGVSVHRLTPDGKRELLFRADAIEQLVVDPSP